MSFIHVALVDDEPMALRLFSMQFRKEIRQGILKLDTYESPLEILDALKLDNDLSNSLVIIFSDINMPEMNGFQLLEEIKNKYPGIKVFMESAYGQDDFVTKAKELGADNYFTKPLDFEVIRKAIFAK